MNGSSRVKYLLLYLVCVVLIAAILIILSVLIPAIKEMISYSYGMSVAIIVSVPAVIFALAYWKQNDTE